jgi:hypothetical protein
MGTLFSIDEPNESFHIVPADDDVEVHNISRAKRSTTGKISYAVYKEKIDGRFTNFIGKCISSYL